MAADLAVLPHTGIFTQLCGDAHVRNLGAYAAPDGRLVFDINDFDETIRGPFEWDLKRLATSIVLAGREAGNKNTACARRLLCSGAIADPCTRFARMPVMEMARFQVHRLQRITPVSQVLRKAERATPQYNAQSCTVAATGQECLPSPHLRRAKASAIPAERAPRRRTILDSLSQYRENLLPERQHFLDLYRPLDVAFRVVGTGSVGLRDYVVYLEGNGGDDPLFLQIKEEPGSAYAPYLGEMGRRNIRAAVWRKGSEQCSSCLTCLLGWTTIDNRQYLVRQLNDHKGSMR